MDLSLTKNLHGLSFNLLSMDEGDVVVCRSMLGFAALVLFFTVEGGFSQDFGFEHLTSNVTEGGNISYGVHILNPSVSNVTVLQTFFDPDGTEVRLDPVCIEGNSTFQWTTPFNNEGRWTLELEASGVDFDGRRLVRENFSTSFTITKVRSRRDPKYVILAVSALTSLFTTLLSYLLVDQKRARFIKNKVESFQKEMLAAQRSQDKKKISRMKKKQAEIMSLQAETMRNQLKLMAIYMVPLLAVFTLLRGQYNAIPVVELPFKLGFMQFFHQNNPISPDQLGFLCWYIICAYLLGSVFRKVMGVVH